MDNNYYFPNAFFAFQTDMLKCDARQIVAPIVMQSLGLYDKKASTPWKFSLYHIDEFEIHPIREMPEAIKRLKDINGKLMSRPLEITCMSSYDITLTQGAAKEILKNNPNTEQVVETAKRMNLNYIIHGVYADMMSTRYDYRDDTKVYDTLTEIVAKLATDKKIDLYSKNFKRQFFAYKEKDEFKIVFP